MVIISQGILKKSSVQKLALRQINTFKKISIIYGKSSLGHFLEKQDIDCIPSSNFNFQNTEEFKSGETHYFEGGYITKHYGKIQKYNCDAVQIEMGYALRNDRFAFESNGVKVAQAIFQFYQKHYS